MTEEKPKFKLEHVPKEWRRVVELRAKQQAVDVDEVIRFGVGHDFKKEREEKQEKLEALKDRKDNLGELRGIRKALEAGKKEEKKP